MNELLLLFYKSDKKSIQYKQERRVTEADRDELILTYSYQCRVNS